MAEHEVDLVVTEYYVKWAQAQLAIVSNEPSAGLDETNRVAGFEHLVAEIYLQTNGVLWGRVMRDVQLVVYSCCRSPATATATEVEARLEGLGLGNNQRIFF